MEAGGQSPVPGGFPPVEPKAGEQSSPGFGQPAPPPPPPASSAEGQSPLDAQLDAGDPFADRPELYVGAAFAGGFVIAKILGRLGR
jgi:hypothetical protein